MNQPFVYSRVLSSAMFGVLALSAHAATTQANIPVPPPIDSSTRSYHASSATNAQPDANANSADTQSGPADNPAPVSGYIQRYQHTVANTNTDTNRTQAVPIASQPDPSLPAPISTNNITNPAWTLDSLGTNIQNQSSNPRANSSQAPSAQTTALGDVFTIDPALRNRRNANNVGIDISKTTLGNLPTPEVAVSNVSFVPTVTIERTKVGNKDKLDVSLLDDFLVDVSPNVRHYPPNFPNRTQKYHTTQKVKALADWIDPYAQSPNASYEVLLRAAKLNSMARNLDLGSDYAVRASKYIARAIDSQPNSGEANFLYGMMLAEGGGFKEGAKYLNKAASLGYDEAEQSLAQSDLLNDRRDQALQRLLRLQNKMPDDSVLQQQIQIVRNGKYYLWDIPAPDIHVAPGT